jgi:putative DNA primase/helicase
MSASPEDTLAELGMEEVPLELAQRRRSHQQQPWPELPSPNQPLQVARIFVEQRCLHEKLPTLRHWHGTWWEWRTSHWIELEDRVIRSLLYVFTEHALYLDDKAKMKAWAPNRRKIADLFEALAAITLLPSDRDQPSWLDGRKTGVIVAVANGLLDVERRELLPHSPLFFNQTAVPFAYDPEAPMPRHWLDFLDQLWPTDEAQKSVLAEWFGYVISGRLDLHKILLMVGPTRGGKGIIARILTALVGPKNMTGPTLNSLGSEFGLAPLIGKPLAVISDARFVGKDAGIVVERLLSISGEDTLTVNRKYKDQWTGKLPSRLHIISNQLPKLGDASAAIIGRIVLLLLTQSWLGREDHALELTLRDDLTGILNWSLDGLERLTLANDNTFTRVKAADDAFTVLRDLASPVAAFVRERCFVEAHEKIECDELYQRYKLWCDDNGHSKSAKHIFGRDLRAAVTTVKVSRFREHDRQRFYTGIRLKTEEDRDTDDIAPKDDTSRYDTEAGHLTEIEDVTVDQDDDFEAKHDGEDDIPF